MLIMSERRTRLITLLAILALAAALRLNAIDYTEFKRDEADAAYQTLTWAREGVFPATAQGTSIGVKQPPLIEYLLLPAAYITADPATLSAYVALFNVAGIYLCYLLASDLFGWRAGITSALLFAANPWAVLYARKLWPQDFMPAFTILFVYSAYQWGVRGRGKYLAPALFLLPCLWSLHLTTIALAALPAMLWAAYKPAVDFRYVLAGLGSAALVFSPYLMHEYGRGFDDFRALAAQVDGAGYVPKGFAQPVVMATTYGFESTLGADNARFEAAATRIPLLDAAAAAALLCGVALAAASSRREPAYLTLLAWLAAAALAPLALFLTGKQFHAHYFLLFFPLQFILSGVFVDRLLSRLCREGRSAWAAVVAALLLATVAYYAVFTLEFQEFVSGEKTIAGDYGMPLRQRVDAVREAVENNRTRVLGEMSKDMANRYVMEYVLDAKEKIVVTGGKRPRGVGG